jgi:hypothetical protein
MKSIVYFRVGESKFRVGGAHPAHPIDKSLRNSNQEEAQKLFSNDTRYKRPKKELESLYSWTRDLIHYLMVRKQRTSKNR